METLLNTDQSIYKVQKKLAVAFSAAGCFVTLFNFIYLSRHFGINTAIRDNSVYLLFAFSLLMLSFAFFNREIIRILQISIVIANAVIAILDVYDSIHGLGLLFIAAFIAFKYGYFKRGLRIKAVVSLLITVALIEFSAQLKNPDARFITGIDAIVFIVLFFFVVYLIYSEEIRQYIESSKVKESTIGSLTEERDLLLERVEFLDKRIARISSGSEPLDLKKYKITAAEKRIIEVLVLYRPTDQDIADRLNLSYHTVKNHFRSIRNKLGVDRREEIIDLCRFNFPEQHS